MSRSQGFVKKSFHELLMERLTNEQKKYEVHFDSGLYYDQVKRYLDTFDPQRVKVIIFEEFVKDEKRIFKQVLEFLQVNSDVPEIISETYNAYGEPRGKIAQKILGSNKAVKISALVPQSLRWKLKKLFILKEVEKPKLSDQDRILLENFYRDDIKKLEGLLHRQLPWDWVHNVVKNEND